ncbi:hypothetical protein AB0A71_32505 [Kitasatospora aureofaciens]
MRQAAGAGARLVRFPEGALVFDGHLTNESAFDREDLAGVVYHRHG